MYDANKIVYNFFKKRGWIDKLTKGVQSRCGFSNVELKRPESIKQIFIWWHTIVQEMVKIEFAFHPRVFEIVISTVIRMTYPEGARTKAQPNGYKLLITDKLSCNKFANLCKLKMEYNQLYKNAVPHPDDQNPSAKTSPTKVKKQPAESAKVKKQPAGSASSASPPSQPAPPAAPPATQQVPQSLEAAERTESSEVPGVSNLSAKLEEQKTHQDTLVAQQASQQVQQPAQPASQVSDTSAMDIAQDEKPVEDVTDAPPAASGCAKALELPDEIKSPERKQRKSGDAVGMNEVPAFPEPKAAAKAATAKPAAKAKGKAKAKAKANAAAHQHTVSESMSLNTWNPVDKKLFPTLWSWDTSKMTMTVLSKVDDSKWNDLSIETSYQVLCQLPFANVSFRGENCDTYIPARKVLKEFLAIAHAVSALPEEADKFSPPPQPQPPQPQKQRSKGEQIK